MKKNYCVQNDGDCSTCSLVNYGKDCRNNPVNNERLPPDVGDVSRCSNGGTPELTCPRCRLLKLRSKMQSGRLVASHKNALSRRDNKTYICSDCGTAEALIDAGMMPVDSAEEAFVAALRPERRKS
jgi:hypothetical protein